MNSVKPILFFLIFLSPNTLCYSQPHTEWVQIYSSPGNYDDYVADMAIDKGGYVYVTGYINFNDTNYINC